MDINIKKFKDDALTDVIVLLGEIMSIFISEKDEQKENVHSFLFYNILRKKINDSKNVFDVKFIEESNTVLVIVKSIDIHYIVEIKPFSNTYDIVNQFIVDSKSGEIIDCE